MFRRLSGESSEAFLSELVEAAVIPPSGEYPAAPKSIDLDLLDVELVCPFAISDFFIESAKTNVAKFCHFEPFSIRSYENLIPLVAFKNDHLYIMHANPTTTVIMQNTVVVWIQVNTLKACSRF